MQNRTSYSRPIISRSHR